MAETKSRLQKIAESGGSIRQAVESGNVSKYTAEREGKDYSKETEYKGESLISLASGSNLMSSEPTIKKVNNLGYEDRLRQQSVFNPKITAQQIRIEENKRRGNRIIEDKNKVYQGESFVSLASGSNLMSSEPTIKKLDKGYVDFQNKQSVFAPNISDENIKKIERTRLAEKIIDTNNLLKLEEKKSPIKFYIENLKGGLKNVNEFSMGAVSEVYDIGAPIIKGGLKTGYKLGIEPTIRDYQELSSLKNVSDVRNVKNESLVLKPTYNLSEFTKDEDIKSFGLAVALGSAYKLFKLPVTGYLGYQTFKSVSSRGGSSRELGRSFTDIALLSLPLKETIKPVANFEVYKIPTKTGEINVKSLNLFDKPFAIVKSEKGYGVKNNIFKVEDLVSPLSRPLERGTGKVLDKLYEFKSGEVQRLNIYRETAKKLKNVKGKDIPEGDIYFNLKTFEGKLSKPKIDEFSKAINKLAGNKDFEYFGSALNIGFEKKYRYTSIGDIDLNAPRLKVDSIGKILSEFEPELQKISKKFKVDLKENKVTFGKEKVIEVKSGINQEILNLNDLAPSKFEGLDMTKYKLRKVGKAKGIGAGDQYLRRISASSIINPPTKGIEFKSFEEGGIIGKNTAENSRGIKDIAYTFTELRGNLADLKSSVNPFNQLKYYQLKDMPKKLLKTFTKEQQKDILSKIQSFSKVNPVSDKVFFDRTISPKVSVFDKSLKVIEKSSIIPTKSEIKSLSNISRTSKVSKSLSSSSKISRSQISSLSKVSSSPSPSKSLSSLSNLSKSPSPSKVSSSPSPSKSLSSLSNLSKSPSHSKYSRSPSLSIKPIIQPPKAWSSFPVVDIVYPKKLKVKRSHKRYYTPTILGLQLIRKTDRFNHFRQFSGLEIRPL